MTVFIIILQTMVIVDPWYSTLRVSFDIDRQAKEVIKSCTY